MENTSAAAASAVATNSNSFTAPQPSAQASSQSAVTPEQPVYALPADSCDATDDDNDMRLWAMLEHPSVWDD